MRHVALWVAILAGSVFVGNAARFGFVLMDSLPEALFSAFIFGFPTAGGWLCHAIGLRVWPHNRLVGTFAYAVAVVATTVSLSIQVGTIETRGSDVAASRKSVSDDVVGWRNDLEAKKTERKGLKFDPADEKTVKNATENAAKATTERERACRYRRGPLCIEKEKADKEASDKKTKAVNDKAASERAGKLDGDIKDLEQKIKEAGPPLDPNARTASLRHVFKASKKRAVELLTWQNLALGAIGEIIILVLLMGNQVLTRVHYEAKSQLPASRAPAVAVPMRSPKLRLAGRALDEEEIEPDELPPLVTTPKPRLISSQSEPFGSVFSVCADILEAGPGRLDFRDLRAAYVKACQRQGKKPVDGQRFAEDVKRMCEATGIKIQVRGEAVYLLNVRLKASEERELEGEAS